jgi:hypothetical protein
MYYGKYILPSNRGSAFVGGSSPEVLVQLVDRGMLIHEFNDEKLVQERIIPELTAGDAASLPILRIAEAAGVAQCFFFAIMDSREFLSELTGYVLQPPEMKEAEMGVTFYGKVADAVIPGRWLVGGGRA